MESEWSTCQENFLEAIRINAVTMSHHHRKRYLYLKGYIKYFKIPIIVLSALNGVASVGLVSYLQQGTISGITCLISLTCGIISSVELFLGVQTAMENEMKSQRDFYLLSIDIFKCLSLERQCRVDSGAAFLEEHYNDYVKMIEQSNVVSQKIKDKLAPLPSLSSISSSSLESVSIDTILSPTERLW